MIRLSALAFAAVLFAVPLLTAALPAVIVTGLVGLLLAAVGIVALWRWPVTAAACVFLTNYAAALWVARAPVSVLSATGFGLSLLFLLQSVELGRRMRHATVDARVVRSQIVAWTGFAAVTLGATMLAMALAGAVAALLPFAVAPLVAVVGALGAVLAFAAAVKRVVSTDAVRGRPAAGRRVKAS